MTPAHHPGEAWLMDYALGNLDQPFEAVLRAHVGVCASCRDTIAFAERLGGEIVHALPGRPVAFDARAICDHHEQETPRPQAVSRAHGIAVTDDIERCVETYLDSSLDALPWRGVGQGLRLCRLGEQAGARTWLLRGKPGTVLPHHTHAGSELTLVLKGAYFCGDRIYRAGDIEDADESTAHQPVITRDGECICLAVTEGRLRFRDLLPRLVQPLLGI
ncbi:MAG: cupin domain-containing protein [Gammaproteobacteria bacterium]|nr:ChrR family anti-sigma-E factor [Gammaproteobacteria bacterium]MCP5199980.1 cupin domain-containing protein [Gammaproteobacteria bacterium]